MQSLKMLLNSSFQEMKDELGQIWSSLNSSEKDLKAMRIAINTTEQELTLKVCKIYNTVCMISVSFRTQQNYKLFPKVLILTHRHRGHSSTSANRAPMAQLVEHRDVTREVVSSTPAGPTLRVLK